MKRSLLLAALTLGLSGSASADPSNCIHGFWIFGHKHIYLSHKPELGSPCHGFQVILEVTLDERGEKAYRELDARGGEMTVEFPQHFLLDEIRTGREMPARATLWDGNFEEKVHPRQVVLKDVAVRVRRKVVFRPINEQAGPGVVQAYLFGDPGERYLANKVDHRPDFDQVVQVETDAPVSKDVQLELVAGKAYSDGHKSDAVLAEGERGELRDGPTSYPFRVVRKVELTQSDDAFAASH